ncbi:hypothetical protein CCZ01_04155 [Helicobacter monodelphidis]|uniref:phospholipase A n=1 Tax=Helicobacter sp. 15-1451 TaxID=2004995 RepID=UPI000DCE2A57|nr:phospholipase A [Helicobacter sp. 15-1451]RAX58012.1 hypothetical protein CCZ01_04155 [Helicobacter sp. 15-1451]
MRLILVVLCFMFLIPLNASRFRGEVPQKYAYENLQEALLSEKNLIQRDRSRFKGDYILMSEYGVSKNFLTDILGITPYRSNYVLPANYALNHRQRQNRTEAKFQLSFKAPLVRQIAGQPLLINNKPITLYLTYTQRSFWQIYDQEGSRPFRESNYQPEVLFLYDIDFNLANFGYLESLGISYMHESNGGGLENSRSWDRIVGSLVYSYETFRLETRFWWRIRERSKQYPLDVHGDDNPDILQYTGNAEAYLSYQFNRHLFSVHFGGSMKHKRGFGSFDYAFLLGNSVYLLVQYYSGYKESLIDYNRSVERLGIGLKLSR